MPHFSGHTHLHRHYQDQGAPGRSDVGQQTNPAPSRTAPASPSHDEIATLAYSYWEARGRQGGSQWEDWFRAERDLRRKA
ncbi:MAG: DUF2934 domain-containing protein [Bryobacteraceae bacterium]